MTPQERALLENFLTQLAQVRGVNKDPEAARLIEQAVQQQPDAAYLLVQRALLLTQALEQAKTRVAELEEAGRDRGFLDPNASGWAGPSSAAPSAAVGGGRQVAPPSYGAPGYGSPGSGGAGSGGPGFGGPASTSGPAFGAPYGAPGYAAPPAYPGYGAAPYGAPVGGGFSSFLGQAAATAAGVAGGEFLFQGLENMFGHHGGGGVAGGGFGGGGFATAPVEDVTINNYYGPEELIVENDFDPPQPDDPDTTFTSDDLSDDQDFV